MKIALMTHTMITFHTKRFSSNTLIVRKCLQLFYSSSTTDLRAIKLRHSFQSCTKGPDLRDSEEIDLLIAWLSMEFVKHSKGIMAVHPKSLRKRTEDDVGQTQRDG